MRLLIKNTLVILLLIAAPASASQERIVGGSIAFGAKFHFIAALTAKEYSDPVQGYFCAGTVIRPRVILTVAHCLENLSPNRVIVRSGSTNLNKAKKSLGFEKRFHPKWDRGGHYDLALISVKKPLQKLPLKLSNTPPKGAILNIAGWGRTEAKKGSPFLNYSVIREEPEQCLKIYGAVFITKTMICVGGRGKNICDGDSGGPIFQFLNRQPVIYGVASWGGFNCRKSPGVFSKVDKDWILKASEKMAKRSLRATRR